MSSPSRYRPEIDGLRCLAVLPVVLFHIYRPLLPGGYLGVDVFFVISGYLITSIILRDCARDQFSFLNFWKKRIRRIIPAAVVVVLVTSLLQIPFIFRPDLEQELPQKLAAIFSVANFYFWQNAGDYWGNVAEEAPFLHYWSLSVEEQYYIFYPFLFVFAFKKLGRKSLLPLIGLIVGVSLAAFLVGSRLYPGATFYLLPTRAWELGAGCLVAVYFEQKVLPISAKATLLGIALIVLGFVLPQGRTGVSSAALLSVLGTCLILSSGQNLVSKVCLENPIVVFIGKISYSLYLWHWPVIVVLKKLVGYGLLSEGWFVIALGTTLVSLLSLLSYYFIEQPFRRQRAGVLIALGLSAAATLSFLFLEPTILKQPYPSSYSPPTSYSGYYNLKPDNAPSLAFRAMLRSAVSPKREASRTAFREGGIIRVRDSPKPRVVLLGDSHGAMYSKIIDEITDQLGVSVALCSINGESPFIVIPPQKKRGQQLSATERYHYDESRRDFIEKWQPDVVIISSRWEKVDLAKKAATFSFLQENSGQVLLLESPPPLQGVGNRSFYQYSAFLNLFGDGARSVVSWDDVNLSRVMAVAEELASFADQRANVSVVPVTDLFLKGKSVITASEEVIYYMDDDHLTNEGCELVRPRLKSAIQRALAE